MYDAKRNMLLERIADTLENISHELSKSKQNTSEFRIAALKRISNAVAKIDADTKFWENDPNVTIGKRVLLVAFDNLRNLLLEN